MRRLSGDATILGSGTIVRQFLDLGLLDALQLVVVPLIPGNGRRLFDDAREARLTLDGSRSFANGLVVLTYRR